MCQSYKFVLSLIYPFDYDLFCNSSSSMLEKMFSSLLQIMSSALSQSMTSSVIITTCQKDVFSAGDNNHVDHVDRYWSRGSLLLLGPLHMEDVPRWSFVGV